jgi:hypothetical protein
MVRAVEFVLIAMLGASVLNRYKRNDFEYIRQDVDKVKKYANDLQRFIVVKKMTSVVDGEAKKQKGAINYDLFELKINLSSELKSFVKDVPKFGVLSAATIFSPVYETSIGVPENRTMSFS